MDHAALITLATEVGGALKQRGWMLTLAESCTGGMTAQSVTAIPGSSAWFERGFVTYSNEAKIELLNVSPETLRNHGAVSEATAEEMVTGALKNSHAQLAVAITGIAGPSGGSNIKPVGTVCFGFASQEHPVQRYTCHFSGDRAAIRQQSVEYALRGILTYLSL